MAELNLDILFGWLEEQGLAVVEGGKTAERLPLKPNLVADNGDGHVCSFFYRESITIPEIILQRFSKMEPIRGIILDIYIVFKTKVPTSTIEQCAKNGVGVLIVGKKKCVVANAPVPKGAASKVEAIQKKTKMPQIEIFFSSKQEFEERNIAVKTIDLIRNSLRKPIWAKLVEMDQRYAEMSANKLNELIIACLHEADYIACILGVEHREIVEWEVKQALSLIDLDRIFIFLKSSKEAKEAWSHVLTFLDFQYKAKGRTVKYIEYTDERDFQFKFHERILVILQKIHSDMDLPLIEV